MKCVTLQFYLHHVSIVFKCASVRVHRHVHTTSCSENESENWIPSLPAQLKKKYIQQNTTKMHKMLYALLLTNTRHYFIFCSHADVLFVSKKMEVMSFIHTNVKAFVWGSHMINFHCFTNLFLMVQITKSKLNYWISCHAYWITNKHCT